MLSIPGQAFGRECPYSGLAAAFDDCSTDVGLCFLYLRNVKGYGYNRKRVSRIYRDFVLNLSIKPKRRLKRDKPAELAVPRQINDM